MKTVSVVAILIAISFLKTRSPHGVATVAALVSRVRDNTRAAFRSRQRLRPRSFTCFFGDDWLHQMQVERIDHARDD